MALRGKVPKAFVVDDTLAEPPPQRPVIPRGLHQRVRLVEAAVSKGLDSVVVGTQSTGDGRRVPMVLVPKWWPALAPLTKLEREQVIAEVERAAGRRVQKLSGLKEDA